MNITFNNVSRPQCSASVTDSVHVKAIKTILLTVVMLAALVGNIFIIAIVYKKKALRRTTNIFIANMAASDMFIAAVVIPRILTELYIGPKRWLFDGALGAITCKFCYFLADFSVCISITSHVVIAFDRFWAIVYSLRPSPITPTRRKYIIALAWLYSVALHSPNLYVYKLRNMNGQPYCIIDWQPMDNFTSQKMFFSVIFLFVFCIPVLSMITLYSWLVISLTGQPRHIPTQTSHIRRQRRKEDIVVLRKVVIIMVVFLGSIIPINVLGLLFFYTWNGRMPCSAWYFSFAAFFLLMSNSAVNPCLCITLHRSYKRHMFKFFSWKYVMNVTKPSVISCEQNSEVHSTGRRSTIEETEIPTVPNNCHELKATKMLQEVENQTLKTLEIVSVSSDTVAI